MATKVQEGEETETVEAPAPQQDGPLLDLNDAAVKKMIKVAKKRGFVTYDQLNGVLPSDANSSDKRRRNKYGRNDHRWKVQLAISLGCA